MEYITGPSSSKHGGVAYIRDVRVVKEENGVLVEVPSQTGDVIFYKNNTISFNIYFLANISKNSHAIYYVFFGAKDPETVEDPLKIYKTDLKYVETKTGGVNVENSFYNVTVDSSLGGWMTSLIHKAGSGTKYVHGSGGGGAFIYYSNTWLSQVFNTKKINYKILALGPIAVHIKFWGPIVDVSKKDVGVGEYETTWIFSAYSPVITIIQNVTLKTVIKANDFRPIQFQFPRFSWYDFVVLQSDRTIYQGSVTKSVDRGGVGVDFNEAYWEIDITRNNPSDAIAVIPKYPVFDLVKEHWYNIGCLDYIKDTRNPDTRTQVVGPGTYKNPVKFFIIIDKSERLTSNDYSKMYQYEKMLKQPLLVEADIPRVVLERKTFSIYVFKVEDILGNPLSGLKIISDEGKMNVTNALGNALLNLTLGKREIMVFWNDLKVGSKTLVVSPREENVTIHVNIAVIDEMVFGTNGTLTAPPLVDKDKILANISASPGTLIVCRITGLSRPPAYVKINNIRGVEGFDYTFKDNVLEVRAVAGSTGYAKIMLSFVAGMALPEYIPLLFIVTLYIAIIFGMSIEYFRKRGI